MYAIINTGNGNYYTSAVFGYYEDNPSRFGSYEEYYIVLDEKKEKLVKKFAYDQSRMPHLFLMVLTTDGDMSGWKIVDKWQGGPEWLSKEDAIRFINNGTPADILHRCLEYDSKNPYKEYQTIESEKDIENLMEVSGCFHDAWIKEISPVDDGIKVLFGGVWGCKIEVTFTGDVSYCTDRRDPEWGDPSWYEATVLLHDGYIYMVDEGDDITVEEINDGLCWFRGRYMMYHVIPE